MCFGFNRFQISRSNISISIYGEPWCSDKRIGLLTQRFLVRSPLRVENLRDWIFGSPLTPFASRVLRNDDGPSEGDDK